MTVWSSFLLAVPPLFVHDWRSSVLSALAVTSVVHHLSLERDYPGRRVVSAVDRVLANGIALNSFVEAMQTPLRADNALHLTVYWFCAIWCLYVYYIGKLSHLPGTQWQIWHATVHAAATLGTLHLLSAKGGLPLP